MNQGGAASRSDPTSRDWLVFVVVELDRVRDKALVFERGARTSPTSVDVAGYD
jgi:hypothetical protein